MINFLVRHRLAFILAIPVVAVIVSSCSFFEKQEQEESPLANTLIPTLLLETAEVDPATLTARIVSEKDGIPVHFFDEEKFTAPPDEHVIFVCPAGSRGIGFEVAHGGTVLQREVRMWGYRYSGHEIEGRNQGRTGRSLFDGDFWLSAGELDASGDTYRYLHTEGLTMDPGNRYYMMVDGETMDGRIVRVSCRDSDRATGDSPLAKNPEATNPSLAANMLGGNGGNKGMIIGDGLNDAMEDVNGNDEVDPGETDPYNPDTDGDSLHDGMEISLSYMMDDMGFDPLNGDSDGNGIGDAEELRNVFDSYILCVEEDDLDTARKDPFLDLESPNVQVGGCDNQGSYCGDGKLALPEECETDGDCEQGTCEWCRCKAPELPNVKMQEVEEQGIWYVYVFGMIPGYHPESDFRVHILVEGTDPETQEMVRRTVTFSANSIGADGSFSYNPAPDDDNFRFNHERIAINVEGDGEIIYSFGFWGCGDGTLDPASEECDDGNQLDGDGCSSMCMLEEGGGEDCPGNCCPESPGCDGVSVPGTCENQSEICCDQCAQGGGLDECISQGEGNTNQYCTGCLSDLCMDHSATEAWDFCVNNGSCDANGDET